MKFEKSLKYNNILFYTYVFFHYFFLNDDNLMNMVGVFSAHMKKARHKDSDQTGRMSMLNWVFAVRSGLSVCLFCSATAQIYFLSFI